MDIADSSSYWKLEHYKFDRVYHFAAESHVDNSINDVMPFVQSMTDYDYCLVHLLEKSEAYLNYFFVQFPLG